MMKNVLVLLTVILLYNSSYGQMGEWTWMNGDSAANSLGHYGTQGVFDSLNTPPGFYEACEWTDLNGNFWLFGGYGYGTNGEYSDLWEFKPTINQWAWMKGPGIINQYGVYGVQGIPSPTNNPGCRGYGVATWTDSSGNLWLSGGVGYAVITGGNLADLWKYNISTNEWTWMKGDTSGFGLTVYGTLNIPNIANTPGRRYETCANWYYNNSLWLFGGIINTYLFSDLWMYNINTNEWTWKKGDSVFNSPGIYGIRGIPNIANYPSARASYAHWKEGNNLWICGGISLLNHLKNDVWRYNIITNEWTWMSGDSTGNSVAVLSTPICIPSLNNMPAARGENRSYWEIGDNNFMFYGGYDFAYAYNDLWNFNSSTNEWTLISGDTTRSQTSIYGYKTISNLNNKPGNRCGANGWKDNNCNLWMFGGMKLPIGTRNDMWRYVLDTSCINFSSCNNETVGIPSTTLTPPQISLYPNPTTGTFTLSYHLSNPNAAFQLLDISGRVVYKHSISGSIGNEIIDASALSSGIYFWQLTSPTETWQGKVVIAKSE